MTAEQEDPGTSEMIERIQQSDFGSGEWRRLMSALIEKIRARSGEETPWEEYMLIWSQLLPLLERVAGSFCRSVLSRYGEIHADQFREDLLHHVKTVLLKVICEREDPIDALDHFAARIVRNRALQKLKQLKLKFQEPLENHAEPSAPMSDPRLRLRLERCLEKLKQASPTGWKKARLIQWKWLPTPDDAALTDEEIAAELDLSESSFRKTLQRGLRELRKILEEDADDSVPWGVERT
ncbi:MAG: hypothetical protein GF355_08530 [Candidatus Eisenbacteria bacterium]|nr:hypothetical protein [Candidatus Eisenbacteria bacterium]